MSVRALDTNVLVSWLIAEDRQQATRIEAMLQQAEVQGDTLLLTWPVLQQFIWVLRKRYKVSRSEILHAISQIGRIAAIKMQDAPAVQVFLDAAQDTSLELDDLLIACACRAAGAQTVVTLDRKASRHVWFELLS